MKILTILTYYRPHISGLTIYVERLAKALVEQGHEVTVLTSQFEPDLPRQETRDGVKIVRAPVILRISKGVIMPTFAYHAWKLISEHDVVHLHLPQFEAAGLALLGRLLRKPTVLTYHCDLELPTGLFNRVVNQVVHIMNYLAGMFTHRIGAYTEDFASHSPYLRRFAKKVKVILPPVALPESAPGEVETFQREHNPESKSPIIGMATRFASEKGVEILLDALPKVFEQYPNAMVLYAGQYKDVLGEDAYFERLFPTIQKYQARGQWKFLDVLAPARMAAFYSNLDVLVVPSLNSTETFGLVQIEAMMNGTPTVASNLPGVRQPPQMTGMGKVIPIGDADALAEALIEIFAHPEQYQGDAEAIARQFSPQTNALAYVDVYRELETRNQGLGIRKSGD
ncbi:MAG: glycosyltransferase family 1 protein [Chloroflexota bacterium]|nr:MAG: glycosyltransferase family 1 protein [Chloroflexota bacterium]